MYSRSSLINLFYLLFYSVVVSFSVLIFFIFSPFDYVNLNSSILTCPNHSKHALSSGILFSTDGSLDEFNDLKARRLCTYNAIGDYHDYYPDPGRVSYKIDLIYSTESSFWEAALAAMVFFSMGMLVVESLFYLPFKIIGKERIFNIGQFYLKIISLLIN